MKFVPIKIEHTKKTICYHVHNMHNMLLFAWQDQVRGYGILRSKHARQAQAGKRGAEEEVCRQDLQVRRTVDALTGGASHRIALRNGETGGGGGGGGGASKRCHRQRFISLNGYLRFCVSHQRQWAKGARGGRLFSNQPEGGEGLVETAAN